MSCHKSEFLVNNNEAGLFNMDFKMHKFALQSQAGLYLWFVVETQGSKCC